MTRALYRLGRGAALHPWRVIAIWIVVAVGVVGLNRAVGGETTDDFRLPGTESQQAIDLLDSRFPAQAGASGQVVFHTDDSAIGSGGGLAAGRARAAVDATLAELRRTEGVVAASDPFDPASPSVSPDGHTAFTTVVFAAETLQAADAERIEAAVETVRAQSDDAVQIEIGGTITQAAQEIEGQEAVGLAVAVLVLLVAFGSVIAMGLPIGTALFGIFVGLSGVSVLAGFADVPTVSPMLATMIGLGVGIDYALFIITRHRQFLHEGWSVPDAAGRANATAGQAVLFAGMTVVVAICGLFVSGIPSVGMMGLASGLVVAVSMIAAVTLLPAFLGLAGAWIDRLRIGRHRAVELSAEETVAGRWAHRIGNRPWPYAIAGALALVALASPLAAMRIAFPDDGNAGVDHTERRAYDLLAEGFGPGFNGPFTIVVDTSAGASAGAGSASGNAAGTGATAAAGEVATALQAESGIAFVAPPALSPDGTTAVLLAYPATAPQDEATTDLVHRLRDDVIPAIETRTGADAYVAGWVPASIDISDQLASRTPVFIAAVVALSFVLLTILFRSVLVPLKAALMNLLSIGASYGLLVAVFQWGWGKELIGLDETVPIFPFVPMIMFAILFGLSMDYEVFLLSRVREEFDRTGDSHRSVVDGLAGTARVITSAALIMISVFGAFVFAPDVQLKMFGLGLSAAVLVDATIVRMVLVPATMALLGNANWWLPGWLDRILPHVDVEGGAALDAKPGPEEPVPARNWSLSRTRYG